MPEKEKIEKHHAEYQNLPESFAIEYLNTPKVTGPLLDMGFNYMFSGVGSTENEVYFDGFSTNGDGTKIRIVVTKGDKYKSPKEIFFEKEAVKRKREPKK